MLPSSQSGVGRRTWKSIARKDTPHRNDPAGGPAWNRRPTSSSPSAPFGRGPQLSIHQVAPAPSQEAGSGGSSSTNSPVLSASMITSYGAPPSPSASLRDI